MRLWREYGSPVDAPGRRVFPAIAGAIRFPEIDEGTHEANFSSTVRIHLKLTTVHCGYHNNERQEVD